MSSDITLYDSTGNPVIVTGDEMKRITTGIFTESPDGSLWELTVDDTGVITAIKVT